MTELPSSTNYLPDEVTYGFVADRIILSVGDTRYDGDRFPDGVPANGVVRFIPAQTQFYTKEEPATILPQEIRCTIYNRNHPVAIENGYDSNLAGKLVDPAGHVGNVALVVGRYHVTYQLDTGQPHRVTIDVKTTHTNKKPLWIPAEAELKPLPQERFVVNERVYREATEARDEAVTARNETQTFRNQTEAYRDQAVAAADALTPSVNVKDFGAVGDGVTNDTQAFHDAIDALPDNGGVVNVPEGIYVAAIRVLKPNTHILGQGWASVIKTQDNSVQLDTDCPIRLLADGCKVTDLMTDGNPEGNTHLNTAALARSADGIGIYANNCYVARVKTSGHLGHHLIAWNDSFPLENIPAGSRQYNVVENCYSVNRGLRNMLDFASTEELGEHDQNINRYNVFRNNIVEGGEIVIHTGWDTVVEGNTIIGGSGVTVHTGSRRVYVRNNILQDCGIVLRGGLSNLWTAEDRRSRNLEAVGNRINNPGTSGIYVFVTDGFLIENNSIDAPLSYGINPEATSYGIIRNNRIDGALYGIRPNSTSGEYRSTRMSITGNYIENSGSHGIYMFHNEGCVIKDNQVVGYGATGIEVTAGCSKSLLQRNTVRGEGIRSIRSNSSADVTISENTAGGRLEVSGTRNIVKGNTVSHVTLPLYFDAGSEGSIVVDNIATAESGDALGGVTAGLSVIKNNVLNGEFVA